MKRLIIFALALVSITMAIGQGVNHTYYYEKVATVVNGRKSTASGDGHYLTMNNKILYESNSNGIYLKRGMMQFEGDHNGLHTYGGNGYLGSGLTYYFASDYSRLNIKLYDGTVYVYERRSQANATSMRKYSTSNNDVSETNVPVSTGGTNNNRTKKRDPDDDYYEYRCVYCDGTGTEVITRPITVSSPTSPQEFVKCDKCGYRYDRRATSHDHRVCPHCNGKGKIRKKLDALSR